MKLTESQLRRAIRKSILEMSTSGIQLTRKERELEEKAGAMMADVASNPQLAARNLTNDFRWGDSRHLETWMEKCDQGYVCSNPEIDAVLKAAYEIMWKEGRIDNIRGL